MKRFLAIYILFFFGLKTLFSQNEIPEKHRFKFAESTLGLSLFSSRGGTSRFLDETGQTQSFSFNTQLYPVLHLGGMHFWNSTELYFGLPFGQLINKKITESHALFTQISDVVGIKYYPWKLHTGKVRPYAGIAISGMSYQVSSSVAANSGVNLTKIVYPVQFGISWSRKKTILDLSAKYNYQHTFDYYISKTEKTTVESPSLYLGLSYKFKLEGTAANREYYYSGKAEEDYQRLKSTRSLNSIFFGIGPSIAFFTKKDKYSEQFHPYLNRHVHTNTFLDLGFGYYHEASNAHLAFAYRNTRSELKAFGTEQAINRNSFLLECNKFLGDYQGFVPFAGIGLGFERLHFSEFEGNTFERTKTSHWAPSLNIGWDILPTKLEYITLRTNLRYFPTLKTQTKGQIIHVEQLEFNIIQLVFYPQRFRHIRKPN